MAKLKYKDKDGFWQELPVGTNVVANPALTGTEQELTSLQVGNVKYKSGGSSGDVTAAGNNIFTGTNWFQGGNTYFMTASGGQNDPITTIDANSVYCQSTGSELGTYYKDSQITHKNFTLTLPYKAGTIALTSDITDTKNTAGSTDTQDKIYLIGATSQAANPQTYSHDTAYVGADGCLYSNNQKVATLGAVNVFTAAGNTFTGALSVQSSSNSNIQTSIGPTGFTRNDGTSGYTYTLPSKSGTIALTSDIPSTSSFATLSGNNTFTGLTVFNNTVSCGTIISNSGFTAQNTSGTTNLASLSYDSIIRTTNNASYTLTIPAKDGTIALTSDIPSGHVYLHKVSFDIVAGDTKGYFTTINNDNTALSSLSAASLEALLGKCFPAAVSGETYQGGAVSVLINVNRSFIVVEGVVLDSAGQSPKRLFQNVNISDLSDTVTQII